jgi:aldehyde dehydrogenase (NAD+)
MVSAAQRDRVRNFIRRGIAEGSKLAVGGPYTPESRSAGFFVEATVFGAVDPDATIAQQEIFGPVVCVIPYDDDAAAVAIANNSAYGLHGAVWSPDVERAMAVARRLRTGSVDINGAAYNPLAPFGGFRKSGVGRELGKFGIEEFTELKSIQL